MIAEYINSEQSDLHKTIMAFRSVVEKKMQVMKNEIISQLAEQYGFDIEDYSEGGNQVFYKDKRIGEIIFDLFPDMSNTINATFKPIKHDN